VPRRAPRHLARVPNSGLPTQWADRARPRRIPAPPLRPPREARCVIARRAAGWNRTRNRGADSVLTRRQCGAEPGPAGRWPDRRRARRGPARPGSRRCGQRPWRRSRYPEASPRLQGHPWKHKTASVSLLRVRLTAHAAGGPTSPARTFTPWLRRVAACNAVADSPQAHRFSLAALTRFRGAKRGANGGRRQAT